MFQVKRHFAAKRRHDAWKQFSVMMEQRFICVVSELRRHHRRGVKHQ
jgi:hypothetical protein